MSVAAEPECVRARPHHDASLTDGGPDNYKKWYQDYEGYHIQCLDWQGPTSALAAWKRFNEIPSEDGAPKHRIFDAGCGTGLVVEELLKTSGLNRKNLEIFGGDFSEDMIGLARKKNLYDDLKIVNLKEELPYEPNTFDSIISSGVFLQGHCGPECVPNVVRVLKRGRYFVTTVRTLFYQKTKEEWKRQIEASNAVLLEDKDVPYMNVAEGVVLVVQKK